MRNKWIGFEVNDYGPNRPKRIEPKRKRLSADDWTLIVGAVIAVAGVLYLRFTGGVR